MNTFPKKRKQTFMNLPLNKTFGVLFLLVSIMSLYSCNKEEKLIIQYPNTCSNGENILAMNTLDTLSTQSDYSLCADLGKKASLKVIITNLSTELPGTPEPVWFFTNENGWTVSEYVNKQQTFTSTSSEEIDLLMQFGGVGKCKIEIFENDTLVPKIKTLFWQ